MVKLLFVCLLAVYFCLSDCHSSLLFSCEKSKNVSSETSLVLKNWQIETLIFSLSCSWLCMVDLYRLLSCNVHYAIDLTFIRRCINFLSEFFK